YPHHSYHEFFTRNSNLVTIITYHINLPINRLMKSIQENKMSIYIGGSRENEMLIEGLSANRFAPNKMLLFLPSIIASKREVSVPTVTSTTGRIWMDRNFGASRVATSMTDEESYGDLYQWGRLADGHEKRTSATIATVSSSDNPGHGKFILTAPVPSDWRNPQNDDLWQGIDGTNNPCPAGFRPPTESEIQEEIDTWSSKDAAGAFASPLKLPASGIRYCFDGSLDTVGSAGAYWSSSVNDTNARLLDFSGDHAWVSDSIRASGFSLRCIKDEPDQVSTVTSATGRVWMDRNLGASRVATSPTDEEAYGDFYQWGRLTDGHEKRTSGTTTTLSSADVPGHENFIVALSGSNDWRNPKNNSLWQGVNGISNPCPTGFRLPTEAELEAERQSWVSNDYAGAFASPLKLVMAGYRDTTGLIRGGSGSYGCYWSSNFTFANARGFDFYSGGTAFYSYNRDNGLSVRCIKD
ncbi:major paralogous domain-containing protein, partial [Candidatus Electrothrix aarhusensis]